MGYIYMLTSPNGKRYIGQTRRAFEQRISQHKCDASHADSERCSVLHRAIKKYGFDNFKKEIMLIVPDQCLDDMERRMIYAYCTVVPHGYNILSGGKSGGCHSIETKMKISDQLKSINGMSDLPIYLSHFKKLKLTGYRIRGHPLHSDKLFVVGTYGRTLEDAKNAAIEYYDLISHSTKEELQKHDQRIMDKYNEQYGFKKRRATRKFIEGRKELVADLPSCISFYQEKQSPSTTGFKVRHANGIKRFTIKKYNNDIDEARQAALAFYKEIMAFKEWLNVMADLCNLFV